MLIKHAVGNYESSFLSMGMHFHALTSQSLYTSLAKKDKHNEEQPHNLLLRRWNVMIILKMVNLGAKLDAVIVIQKLAKKLATIGTVKYFSKLFYDRLVCLTRDYDEVILARLTRIRLFLDCHKAEKATEKLFCPIPNQRLYKHQEYFN